MQIINTRDLEKGDIVKVDEEILTFNGMDGMYGKFLDKNGLTYIFNAKLKKNGEYYKIATRNDFK